MRRMWGNENAGHDAVLLMLRLDDGIENIFEACKLGDGLTARAVENLVRCALGDDVAGFENENAITETERLATVVRYKKNGDGVVSVPGAQVVDNAPLRGSVEATE